MYVDTVYYINDTCVVGHCCIDAIYISIWYSKGNYIAVDIVISCKTTHCNSDMKTISK